MQSGYNILDFRIATIVLFTESATAKPVILAARAVIPVEKPVG